MIAIAPPRLHRQRQLRRLIEDLRALGEQLLAIGEAESKRFPRLPGMEQTNAGASPEQAQARVRAMSDEEVRAIAAKLDALPAGGRRLSDFELIVVILLIILIAVLL